MVAHPTEFWKQFSLYSPGCRNKFQPLEVLYTFLPDFVLNNKSITRWHILFEPSALVRFQSDYPHEVLTSAKHLAEKHWLIFELGDCSHEYNKELKCSGEDYYGEAHFYGEELWQANAIFLEACSILSLAMVKLSHKEQVLMTRKHIHLLGNILGMNYLEEASIARSWADRCMELYKDYGRS